MRIESLQWDDYRVDHIARHNVDAAEVWEVCPIVFTLRTAKAQTVIESMDKLKRDVIYL